MAEANWHPKREARQFEMPPWEREQFEALQRRREQEAPVQAEEPAAVEEPALPEPAEPEVPTAATAPQPDASPAPAAANPSAPPVPDAEIDAMLAALHAEEPKVDEHLKPVTVFASAIAMLLGVSMLAWGLFALINSKGVMASVIGAMIVLGMGLVFGITGFVAGWRATNKQGEE